MSVLFLKHLVPVVGGVVVIVVVGGVGDGDGGGIVIITKAGILSHGILLFERGCLRP